MALGERSVCLGVVDGVALVEGRASLCLVLSNSKLELQLLLDVLEVVVLLSQEGILLLQELHLFLEVAYFLFLDPALGL